MEQIGVESVFITKDFDKGIRDYNDSLKKAQESTDSFSKKSEDAFRKSEEAAKKAGQAYTQDYLSGLNRGTAGSKQFSDQLMASAEKMGLSTKEISRMAGATGFYTEKQLLAAQASKNVAAKADELTQKVAKGEMTTREAGAEFAKYAKTQEVVATQTARTSEQTAKLKQALGNMATAAAAAASYAVIRWLKDASTEAGKAEVVLAKLDAILKSTGGSAGVAKNDILAYAEEMAALTGVEHEVIINGAALMLTFTKISKEMFPQAMTAAMNLSAVFGQDLQSSIIQVSKALQDPAGMSAMKRIGVSFSAAQIEMGKAMFETGDIAGYQAMVMKELNKEVGGAAVAIGSTFAGSMEKLKVATGEVTKEFGFFINNGLEPAIKKGIEWANSLANAIRVEAAIDKAQKDGLITMEEANNLINEMTWSSLSAADAEAELAKATGNLSDEVRNGLVSYKTYTKNLTDAKLQGREFTKQQQETILMWRAGKIGVEQLAVSLGGMTEKEYTVAQATGTLTKAINVSVGFTDSQRRMLDMMGNSAENAGDDIDGLSAAQKRNEEAARLAAVQQEIYRAQLSELSTLMNGKLGSDLLSFQEKQRNLNQEARNLQFEIGKLNALPYLTEDQKTALSENKTKLSEIEDQITKNADAHDEATKRILLDILTQRAAMDGLTTDEVTMITTIAQKWGLIDEATATAMKNADIALVDLKNGAGINETISKFETMNGLAGGIASSLNSINGKTFTANVQVNTNYHGNPVIQGSQFTPAAAPATSADTARTSARTATGHAKGAAYVVPPGYSNERWNVGTASSGETVLIIPKIKSTKTTPINYSPAMAAQPVSNSYSNAATVNMGGVNIYNGMGQGQLEATMRNLLRAGFSGA